MIARLLFLAILSTFSSLSMAAEAQVPVVVGYGFINQVLHDQVFTGASNSFYAVKTAQGCQYLQLSNPQVDAASPHVRVLADAKAQVGRRFGSKCLSVLQWSGKIEVVQQLVVAQGGQQVRAKVVQSRLLTRDGEKAQVSNTVWQWINDYVHPKMESVVFDMRRPVKDLQELLYLVLPKLSRQEQFAIVKSVKVKEVQSIDKGVQFRFGVDVPDRYTGTPPPSPPLTPAELEKVKTLLNQLDGFYTAVLKKTATGAVDDELQAELLTVLVELRIDIVDILTGETQPQTNPVPALFLKTWQHLTPVMKKLGTKSTDYRSTMQTLSFITAADALHALDQAGPALGVDMSPAGLRRLARILIPNIRRPLAYSEEVDPGLREAFGFGPPLEVSRYSFWDALGHWFFQPAYGAVIDAGLSKQLNTMVPTRKNLDTYLPLVDQLFKQIAEHRLQNTKLNGRFHNVYRWLVTSTAWKESCWRQFVHRRGKRTPLKSNAGAVGIMQVVPKVWRGFYEPKHLQWDFIYNAKAGAEILMRYMKRYAIRKKEHHQAGGLDNLARASYAAYNAGPGKLRRYRNPKATKRQKQVDNSFYQKYLKVKKGQSLAVKTCY